MKRYFAFVFLLLVILCLAVTPLEAACRNPNIVQEDPYLVPAAASGFIEIKWFVVDFGDIGIGLNLIFNSIFP